MRLLNRLWLNYYNVVSRILGLLTDDSGNYLTDDNGNKLKGDL